MERITYANVFGAYKRLHRAMEWPDMPHYSKQENGIFKANIGAVALSETGYGFNIEIIVNDGGGVHTPFMGWSTKREAFEGMASMAAAVEEYKRSH